MLFTYSVLYSYISRVKIKEVCLRIKSDGPISVWEGRQISPGNKSEL